MVAGAGEFCLCFVEVDRVQTTKTATAIKLAEKKCFISLQYCTVVYCLLCHFLVGHVVFFAMRVNPVIFCKKFSNLIW